MNDKKQHVNVGTPGYIDYGVVAGQVERFVMRDWLYIANNQLCYKKPKLRLLVGSPGPSISRAALTVWWFAQGEDPEINKTLNFYGNQTMHEHYGAYDAERLN